MNADCHQQHLTSAYVSEDLTATERAEFEQHLARCGECRATVESTRVLVRRLRSMPKVEVSRDLTQGIWSRLREPDPVQFKPRRRSLTAAAAAAAFLFGGALWQTLQGGLDPKLPVASSAQQLAANEEKKSFRCALDWFCQHQEADGSWDAERWGGNRRFAVALTALPVIALLESGNAQHQTAADHALEYLRNQQRPDGTFGARFREAAYVQSATTFALLRAYQENPRPALRSTLDAAMRVILSSQAADGGWGYDQNSPPNQSITRWHAEVVALAASLSWTGARESLDRANHWLADHSTAADLGTEPIGEITADFHHAYFAVASLRQDTSNSAQQQLAAIRRSIVARQAQAGEESGTWQPTDQWSRVGGRLYSTALASLALR
jgi:hypothetical protein